MNKWISRILASKTMVAFLILDIIGIIQLNDEFLSTVMTPSQFGWMLLGIGIIGKILRTITSQPLSEK